MPQVYFAPQDQNTGNEWLSFGASMFGTGLQYKLGQAQLEEQTRAQKFQDTMKLLATQAADLGVDPFDLLASDETRFKELGGLAGMGKEAVDSAWKGLSDIPYTDKAQRKDYMWGLLGGRPGQAQGGPGQVTVPTPGQVQSQTPSQRPQAQVQPVQAPASQVSRGGPPQGTFIPSRSQTPAQVSTPVQAQAQAPVVEPGSSQGYLGSGIPASPPAVGIPQNVPYPGMEPTSGFTNEAGILPKIETTPTVVGPSLQNREAKKAGGVLDLKVLPMETLPQQVGTPGLILPGNIDVSKQPTIKNSDGSISTLRSFSVGLPEGEVLLPTVMPDGRVLTETQALAEYRKTGRHLGIFSSPEAATSYAKSLSNTQGVSRRGRGTGPETQVQVYEGVLSDTTSRVAKDVLPKAAEAHKAISEASSEMEKAAAAGDVAGFRKAAGKVASSEARFKDLVGRVITRGEAKSLQASQEGRDFLRSSWEAKLRDPSFLASYAMTHPEAAGVMQGIMASQDPALADLAKLKGSIELAKLEADLKKAGFDSEKAEWGAKAAYFGMKKAEAEASGTKEGDQAKVLTALIQIDSDTMEKAMQAHKGDQAKYSKDPVYVNAWSRLKKNYKDLTGEDVPDYQVTTSGGLGNLIKRVTDFVGLTQTQSLVDASGRPVSQPGASGTKAQGQPALGIDPRVQSFYERQLQK